MTRKVEPRRPYVWAAAALLGSLVLLAAAGVATAQDAEAPAAPAAPAEQAEQSAAIPAIWWVAPAGAIAALIFAWVFHVQVKRANPGDEKMQEIAEYVRQGAYAYLKRQYKVVAVFFLVASGILAVMGMMGVQHKIVWAAFLTGGFFSGLCGFLGMRTATLAASRTTQGAKEGLDRGLQVAFRAGSVMGLVVVGFGLLYITVWFLILVYLAPLLGYTMSTVEITAVMLTFGMGASSQALFARVGGGIFTKAADVGADLVGKVEAGIPEDDPRNPATIADNVGDFVGDVAGMGADLYESYCGSILAACLLGVAAAASLSLNVEAQFRMLAAPMALAGVGIILSIIGIYLVRAKKDATMKQLMGALELGVWGSSALILVGGLGVCYLLLSGIEGVSWLGVWGAIASGLLAGVIIGKSTEYYTSYDHEPTREIARQSETGSGTVIIAGLAEGMKSSWAALVTVIVAIMCAFAFAGGFENMPMGLYGVGIAAVGMLATLGITLATDAYGPIADNAGGNAEMTGQEPEVRKRTDALDSLGNTTAATGKGFAIGSAALTALALLAAYVQQVRVGLIREGRTAVVRQIPAADKDDAAGVGELVYIGHKKFAMKVKPGTDEKSFDGFLVVSKMPNIKPGLIKSVQHAFPKPGSLGMLSPADDDGIRGLELHVGKGDALLATGRQVNVKLASARDASLSQYMGFYGVTLINPKVLCGMLAGVLLVFLFSAMTMKAVGRAANAMVKEVRRQFKEIPGIMEGTARPDYARCVAISTAGAQKEMIVPSLLALIVPVAVGLLLDVGGVLGLLAGGLTCGFAMAIFMANAGGAWDNAKKWVETGELGGKGSDAHKATVVGDTVGDPFKDTSGPSLNILIKLMGMVSVVFAGVIVKYGPQIAELLHLQ